MVDVNKLISQLNEEQVKPVMETEGAVLVIAGAGSGKTRVLTTRIAHLVMNKNVKPGNILAITFTNKAANEMKERLTKIIGSVEDMWVSTIHSMCVKILRRDIEKIGYDKNFTIYDDSDKDKALKLVLNDLKLDVDKFQKPAKNYISLAKNDGLSPEDFAQEYAHLHLVDQFYAIYKAYEEYLERTNSLDFDDLLLRTYQLFETHPEVVDYYSHKFQYVHIDEFQDTNKVQFAIARMLARVHGNIFVVGDDDQSIYSWRGARIENILKFDDIYRGASIFKLERNYRSTKKILSLANCIIANNRGRREKNLWTDNSEGCKIETFVATDENSEASYVATQIKNIMARCPNYKLKDFAVFMRINALSRAVENEFNSYGISYRVYGGFRFFERKEIKDVLSYLKIVNNPYDDQSFLRCVGCPKRGIGDKSLTELREFAVSINSSMLLAIDRLEETTLNSGTKTKLINFRNLINDFKEYSKYNSVSNLIAYILASTSFMEQFAEKNDENTAKCYNISELQNSAQYFIEKNEGATLSDYLHSVTLSSDSDDINNDDVVTIASIHAVKGLEYKCVFVIGLDDGIMPVSSATADDDELEEERRLMYVAVTRAKERLYLTRSMSRFMYGKRDYMTQSRFLKEASEVLGTKPEQPSKNTYDNYRIRSNYGSGDYEERDISSRPSGYSSDYAKKFLSNSKPKEIKTTQTGQYKTGVRVKHVKFGVGTVIMVKGEGDNIIADVAFQGHGIKSLSIKYAPMEII